MAQPTLLSIAKADLVTASKNIDNPNKFIKHQAAYMTQQSVEKTLKYLIGLKIGNMPWGYKIAPLVAQAKALGIWVPDEVSKRANTITRWEAVTRYNPQEIIRRDVVHKVIISTPNLHVYLSKRGIK